METKVGIGVAIFKGNQVLLGKRKGSHGEGQWAFPGGKMEHLESFEQTALREIAEEVGSQVRVKNLRVCSVINLTTYEPKHYIDIGMAAEWVEGEPEITEPDKCYEWKWFTATSLPTALFATVGRTIEAATSYETQQFDTAFVWDKE